MRMNLIALLLLINTGCSDMEVQSAEHDTALIWAKSCKLMKTCNGYSKKLSDAMKDGKITYGEFGELEKIYNQGEVRFYAD